MVNTFPEGCTHVELANPLNFDQRPTFLKWGFDFYSQDSGNTYCCWYVWHQQSWCKDYGYMKPKDPDRFMTTFEYRKKNENSGNV